MATRADSRSVLPPGYRRAGRVRGCVAVMKARHWKAARRRAAGDMCAACDAVAGCTRIAWVTHAMRRYGTTGRSFAVHDAHGDEW